MSDGRMLELVEQFCVSRGVSAGTRFTIAPNLADALWTVHRKGPDRRWLTVTARGDVTDVPGSPHRAPTTRVERLIFAVAVQQDSAFDTGPARRPWFLGHTITSIAHWARLSRLLRDARAEGLGWLVPAHKHVVLVPLPRMSMAEERTDVLHDDTGRPAVEWADGTGYHFLQGVFFIPELYRRVIGSELSLAELCLLSSVDHRSIALSYMKFEDLVNKAGAQLIDRGQRGTSLFRLWLPDPIARDRPRGYGDCDYFIHMRDASHPEREFIEWVDPDVGIHGDAELCQAHAFGISLQEWLSIEQAG
jgi:hypothetical protein